MAKEKIEVYDILGNVKSSVLRDAWIAVKARCACDKEAIRDLDIIFEANMREINRFPNVNGAFVTPINCVQNVETYLERWANRYLHAELPSKREGSKSKSPYDPMIYDIIAFLENPETCDVGEIRKNHEMAMQAENIIGELLEEYINSVISHYGWIWCKGSSMRATDFYYPGEPELFLQVKNKFNTENSSSSNIRSGTQILKWNRLINKKVPGTNAAVPNWDALRDIVFVRTNKVPYSSLDLSEDGFKCFVENVCNSNPRLVVS